MILVDIASVAYVLPFVFMASLAPFGFMNDCTGCDLRPDYIIKLSAAIGVNCSFTA